MTLPNRPTTITTDDLALLPHNNPRRVKETRAWVMDPAGHRAFIAGQYQGPESGDKVPTPFGEATVLRMPLPDDYADWYCDLCSKQILTRFGNEPFPVPMFSTYALCLDHFNEMQQGPATDAYSGEDLYEELTQPNGEVISVPVLEGPWPLVMCRCPACYETALAWKPYIEPILMALEEVLKGKYN